MKRIGFVLLAVFVLAGAATLGQSPKSLMDNGTVVHDVALGLSDPVIIALIQNSPGNYDVKPDALLALSKENVSSAVVAAMIQQQSKQPPVVPHSTYALKVSPTLVISKAYYHKGVPLALIRTPTIKIMAFFVDINEHYGYEKVALMVRNLGTQPIDINPASGVFGVKDADCSGCPFQTEAPMEQNDVEEIAGKIHTRESWGILASSFAGTMAANQYSQYSPTNAYEQSRSDEAADAASAASEQEYDSAVQKQFLESTIAPGEEVDGWVYFNVHKKTKKNPGGFPPDFLDIVLGGVTYRLII